MVNSSETASNRPPVHGAQNRMMVRPAYLLGISPRAAWLISGRRLEVLPAAFWSAETGPVQAASAAVPATSPRAERRWRRVRERSRSDKRRVEQEWRYG